MIPMMSAIKITSATAIISAIFYSGWTVNGWRLHNEISSLKNSLSMAQDINAVMSADVEAQNRYIEELHLRTTHKLEESDRILAEAEKRQTALMSEIDMIRQFEGASMEEASNLIDKALQL